MTHAADALETVLALAARALETTRPRLSPAARQAANRHMEVVRAMLIEEAADREAEHRDQERHEIDNEPGETHDDYND